MSLSIPRRQGYGNTSQMASRRVANSETQRLAAMEAEAQYNHQRDELKQVVAKQAKRIEDLKLNTAVQLEHQSTLRRLELEQRKSAAEESIAMLMPRLEVVRNQWAHSKEQNQGYELQWGTMRTQFQQVKSKVDALKDQITDGRAQIENNRATLKTMREHLHKLDRDKAQIRGKIKRALECLVIDDNFLTTRVAEEEQYNQQLQQALAAMETEYQDSQTQYHHEFAPLEEDVRLLTQYLEEMQARTKDLQRYCLELEGKTSTIEEHWMESVHAVFEGLERANNMDRLKNAVLKYLEQQSFEYKEAGVQPRGRGGHMDAYWLSNAVGVWESIVREVVQERQKMHIRDENSKLVAETSQKCQQAKAQLKQMKEKVYGQGNSRRQLFMEISDIHYLVQEKKESEEDLIRAVQEEATKLDEDLSAVLQLIRKEGFDDYVSSTDEEGPVNAEEGESFQAMAEEGNDDITQIVSSMDLDPDDPHSAEALKRMAHRREGPLREFAARRAQYLQRAPQVSSRRGPGRQRGNILETLERALMDVQVSVSDEVIAFVRNRQQAIQAGTLDPKQERLQADPRYVTRAREMAARRDRWVEDHKDTDNLRIGRGQQSLNNSSMNASALSTTQQQPNQLERPIVIDGARVPPDVARADPISKTVYFVGNAVRGFNFMMYSRQKMGPELRQVFLARDFSRIFARRVGGEGDDVQVMRLADIVNIVQGHKTETFRDMLTASRHPLRPELAFSLISHLGPTFDLECDSAEDRNHWCTVFAWVVNESRRTGNLAALTRARKIAVIDVMNRTGPNEEPRDRSNLQVQITP
jgi:hypothetical protein